MINEVSALVLHSPVTEDLYIKIHQFQRGGAHNKNEKYEDHSEHFGESETAGGGINEPNEPVEPSRRTLAFAPAGQDKIMPASTTRLRHQPGLTNCLYCHRLLRTGRQPVEVQGGGCKACDTMEHEGLGPLNGAWTIWYHFKEDLTIVAVTKDKSGLPNYRGTRSRAGIQHHD